MNREELLEELELSLQKTNYAIEYAQQNTKNADNPETQAIHRQAAEILMAEANNLKKHIERLSMLK